MPGDWRLKSRKIGRVLVTGVIEDPGVGGTGLECAAENGVDGVSIVLPPHF